MIRRWWGAARVPLSLALLCTSFKDGIPKKPRWLHAYVFGVSR